MSAGSSLAQREGLGSACAGTSANPCNAAARDQRPQMDVVSRSTLPMHPLTLAFKDPACERAYQKQQRDHHAGNELWLLNMHIVCGVLQLSTVAYISSGGHLFSWLTARTVVPYTCFTVLHRCSARTAFYQRHRTACALCFEMVYIAICIEGLPSWVLAQATGVKTWIRNLILGSGCLLAGWFAYFSNKPFVVDLVAIPVQFGALAALLTVPTCTFLEGNASSRATTWSISASLDALAAATTHSCPTHSCANIVYTWDIVLCAALVYMRHAVDYHRRARFAAPAHVDCGWPAMPSLYVAVLQLAVALQLLSALWGVLQCSRL